MMKSVGYSFRFINMFKPTNSERDIQCCDCFLSSLKTFTKNHDFKTYKGLSHSSSPAELLDIKTFMQKLLPAEK